MPLSLLSGLTVLLMDENSLPNCRVFHHLEACFLGRELPPVLLRIEFALIEQRLAADERGGLPLVEADFKAEFLHVHQLLEQRKPFLGFLDDGFQE